MTQNKCSYSTLFRVLMAKETAIENTSFGKIKFLPAISPFLTSCREALF